MQTLTKDSMTTDLIAHFSKFREGIIGSEERFTGPFGEMDVLYADWIASGRLYRPIEEMLMNKIGPVVANPHSYSSYTGRKITGAYAEARKIIKRHVNAGEDDVLVTVGGGMTAALMRLQEIMGLKNTERAENENDRPIVFITHMEHHSNHVSWLETGCDVIILPPDDELMVDTGILRDALELVKDRKMIIGAFTACSNVTGIITPYHELAEIIHEYGGYCIVDFAASAPYVHMDMHPENPAQKLDAICFSPHKFLGGPGACGILVFDGKLHNGIPTIPGGGNVKWTDPWGQYGYTKDIEAMEDGGTPAFLQAIKAALAIELKEKMNPDLMKQREHELMRRALEGMLPIDGMRIVGNTDLDVDRIGALSFNIKDLHYNLVVRLLNDKFGVQVRGGWSCASTYGHYLFQMDEKFSSMITGRISENNMTGKPGWVRVSLHPTMTNEELDFIIECLEKISEHGEEWAKDYKYNPSDNEYYGIGEAMNKPVIDTTEFFRL